MTNKKTAKKKRDMNVTHEFVEEKADIKKVVEIITRMLLQGEDAEKKKIKKNGDDFKC